MAKEKTDLNILNLTVVALVALVAIVGVTAIVLNGHARATQQSTLSKNTAGLARGTVARKSVVDPSGGSNGDDCMGAGDCNHTACEDWERVVCTKSKCGCKGP